VKSRNKARQARWPTLKGRLSSPLTNTRESIKQMKDSGVQLTPLAKHVLNAKEDRIADGMDEAREVLHELKKRDKEHLC
jgi:hypothetical protein